MTDLKKLHLDLCMTSVFHSVLDKPLFMFFDKYFQSDDKQKKISAYASMVAEIYKSRESLTDLVLRLIFEDENVYIQSRASGKKILPEISDAVFHELSVFEKFAALTPNDFSIDLGVEYVSPFSSENRGFVAEYENRIKNINKHGYGIFSSYPMFRLDDSGEILPIISADKTSFESFIGYAEQRSAVIENTEAFVSDRPARNVLLYGDAGTGKSSTVKAIANEFFDRGVRLIELRKDQLSSLPEIMGRISENPLKFIIFIDDLSFNKSDDNFSMLKAALEGSASAKAENAIIYATSNRRHIVRESFDDREGRDVHVNDTMQEKLSLSDRFGLSVRFEKPDKKLYLEIVEKLAERHHISIDKSTLYIRAEEFALRRGNRSPRCAEQFIKSLL